MAYASEHPALVALELLNYWTGYPTMQGYRLFSADINESDIEIAPGTINTKDHVQTQAFGDLWVSEQRSFALRVPSVAVPFSFNFLINPGHPRMASFTYVNEGNFDYDPRVNQLIATAKTPPSTPSP